MTEGLSSQLSSLPLDFEGNLVYRQPFFHQSKPAQSPRSWGWGTPLKKTTGPGE
jgi:hypothetical protein